MSIALMVETANISETSVHIYQTTWHNSPEDSRLSVCAAFLTDKRLSKADELKYYKLKQQTRVSSNICWYKIDDFAIKYLNTTSETVNYRTF
jgi:hypothetical protein